MVPSVDLSASIVVWERDDFGQIQASLGEMCVDREGNFYIDSKKLLYSSGESVDLTEAPSKLYSREQYIKAIDSVQGFEENLPSHTLSELLNNIALTKPGTLLFKHGGKSCYIYAQSACDLPRSNWIRHNQKDIYNALTHSAQNSDDNTKEIFSQLLPLCDYDLDIANNFTILLTQGCMAKLATTLWMRYSNPGVGMQLANRGSYYKEIFTIDKKHIVVRQTSFFALIDTNNDGEVVRWTKVAREFFVSKEDLKYGLSRDSRVKDFYFPFFSTWVDVLGSEIEPPETRYCTIL